jgi:hypothetical protein
MKKMSLFLAVIALVLSSCGGGGSVNVSANILLPNGTVMNLTDGPLPLSSRIQLTFDGEVDPARTEALLQFTAGAKNVARRIAWNADNTVMTIDPIELLDYQTTYTVSLAAGSAMVAKSTIEARSWTFKTMVKDDINGDGLADFIPAAPFWVVGPGQGRAYLVYGGAFSGGSAASASAIITGENANNYLSSCKMDDINDDGYADLVCNSGSFGPPQNRIYIFLGASGATPISGSIDLTSAPLIIDGETNYISYAGSNDVNGDGISDLVFFSSDCNSNAGCIYIFSGPTVTSKVVSAADIIITGENAGDYLDMTEIGDVNNDGIADIVASANAYGSNTGRIYVIYGRVNLASMSAALADAIITGENAGDFFTFMQLADANGDGIKDIVSTAYNYGGNTGRMYIFYSNGLASMSASSANVIFTGEAAGDRFGRDVVVDDVSGDGTNDIIVGAFSYSTNTGRVYGFLGDAGLESRSAADADFIFTGENANDRFILNDIGDVNGDGKKDIITEASDYPAGAKQGRIYAFYGGSSIASRSASSADVIFTGENANDQFHFLHLLDWNGDNIYDIAGGAPGYNANFGRAYLFLGGSSLSSKSASEADMIMDGEAVGGFGEN